MKTKRYHNTRGWGRALSALLALALAVGLALTVPPLDGLALATGDTQTPAGGEPTGTEGGEPQATEPPPATGLTEDFDPAQKCSLTLKFPESASLGTTISEDEQKALTASVAVDYYKVASAVPVAGYNVYDFEVKTGSSYYNVIKEYVESDKVSARFVSRPAGNSFFFRYEPGDPDKAPVGDWTDLMELLAQVCFEKDEKPVKTAGLGEGKPAEELDPGLYLIVVHGDDAHVAPPKAYNYLTGQAGAKYDAYPEYIIEQMVAGADNTMVPALRSIAYTNTNVYIFNPQLIALPGSTVQVAGGTVQSPNGLGTTLTGDWLYDMEAYIKFIQKVRFADLEISKQVINYSAANKPVTFVYQVTAVAPSLNDRISMNADLSTALAGVPEKDDKGALQIIRTTKTITFDPTQGSTGTVRIIDLIPAGWTVVVDEVYTGPDYHGTGTVKGDSKDNANKGAGETPAWSFDAGPTSTRTIIRAIPGGTVTRLGSPDMGQTTAPDYVVREDGITVTTAFTNDYDLRHRDGGSVVNTFLGDGNGWYWNKRQVNEAGWNQSGLNSWDPTKNS